MLKIRAILLSSLKEAEKWGVRSISGEHSHTVVSGHCSVPEAQPRTSRK
jgi:hypothetical protein